MILHAYVHIHTFIHSCIHTFIHSCMHTCIHSCIHSYIHHTFIYTYRPNYPMKPHYGCFPHDNPMIMPAEKSQRESHVSTGYFHPTDCYNLQSSGCPWAWPPPFAAVVAHSTLWGATGQLAPPAASRDHAQCPWMCPLATAGKSNQRAI